MKGCREEYDAVYTCLLHFSLCPRVFPIVRHLTIKKLLS